MGLMLHLIAHFINRSSGLSQHSAMTAFVKWALLFGLITEDVFTLKICMNRGESNSNRPPRCKLPFLCFSRSCDVKQQLKALFKNKLYINVK